MSDYTLGLDLGPNSIGWALIDEQAEKKKIIDTGVRIFPEGVDQFDTAKEVSRNEDRRVARGMRRQIQRRRRRKRLVRAALISAGLLPENPDEQAALLDRDPYELRARALEEKLSPHELGRIFVHLAQRRGFLSNRKKDRGDKEVAGMLAEISELEKNIQESGCQTLGQWLFRKSRDLNHAKRAEDDHIRRHDGTGRHTRRDMYEAEFDAIWEAQRSFGHGSLLTDALKHGRHGKQTYPCKPRPRRHGDSPLSEFGLHGLIFFQRPMYWPRSAVGSCEFEPKQKRCPKADRRAQRFRLLQEVNNIRYTDLETGQESPLDDGQRALLLDKLGQQEKMTFDQIRKAFGFLESVKFNLEKGKRSQIQGMIVDYRLAKATGKSWHKRPEEEKDAIVRLLIDHEQNDDALIARLVDDFGMMPEQADAALSVDLPSGHLNVSLKAINKILPHLEKGLIYQSVSDPKKSAIHAAGYLRRDELRRRLFDRLPDPERTANCPIGDLPNPVVKRTLVELRKVVNAIVREYGKPAAVHVEMARDVKTRPKKGTEAYRKYQEQIAENRYREERRGEAAEKLRENRIKVSRDNITRYILWEDQRQACMYSGEPISFGQLFGGEVDVDHILPRSKTLDDSQNNKVVCFRRANADKGDRFPHQWLADSRPEQYEQVCARASRLMREGRMPYAKYRRFLQKELNLDDFIERQLNDTRYIARLAAEYLRCLFEADHHVLGVKGQLTHELRHDWGIENLLEQLPDSPAWQESDNLRPGEKNRADHRHHAIDAVVVALTNRKRLQELSRIHQAGGTEATGEIALDPWDGFRDDLKEAVARINVSHRAERKVSGRLHEETLYGKTDAEGQWVVRKPVAALSPNEIERIRDEGIKRIVTERLREEGIEFGRGKKVDPAAWKKAMADLKMPSGVPIKKVRILKPDLTIQPIREGTPNQAYVKPGSTHHLCIFEFDDHGKPKREAVFVTMLEATRRLKNREPVIQRTHPEHPEARFIMSLCRGEMVLANYAGNEKLLMYKTAASTTGQMIFVEHTDARDSSSQKGFSAKATTLDGRKVTVDLLGRIRWAGD
ncbi:MAG: type II CRISPR RNA-guided endonuclease Cas9 [Pirellulales bacterium]|nr:type II CRISPR RNA-guided endonuclease Cas9 [Pirellulales bacterium]